MVLEAHVVAAGQQLLDSNWDGTLVELANEIVKRYVKILNESTNNAAGDEVHTYACEVISLGLLWFNYVDATWEGDGGRVMNIWKY